MSWGFFCIAWSDSGGEYGGAFTPGNIGKCLEYFPLVYSLSRYRIKDFKLLISMPAIRVCLVVHTHFIFDINVNYTIKRYSFPG